MTARTALLSSALLALSATGADELAADAALAAGCPAAQSASEAGGHPVALSVAVHLGSRLLARRDLLELQRGVPLPCTDARVMSLQSTLLGAASSLPYDRVPRLLRIHLDPRLPSGEAPLGAAEVHVSSRELLITDAALAQLPARAWRHELLHVLAAAPPPASEVARRLWLTLEEGLVQYAAQRSERLAALPGGREAPAFPALPAPVWEQLALPVYDPHELAAGWASQLERAQPPLELPAAVACLAAPAAAAVTTLHEAASGFVQRCPADVAPVLHLALQRWLPGEWGGGLAQPRALAADSAALSSGGH